MKTKHCNEDFLSNCKVTVIGDNLNKEPVVLCFICSGKGTREMKIRYRVSKLNENLINLLPINNQKYFDISHHDSFSSSNQANKIDNYKELAYKTITKTETISCKNCHGVGYITKSKRRDSNGNFIKKKVTKSYPHFTTFGPIPFHDKFLNNTVVSTNVCIDKKQEGTTSESNMTVHDNEELCYLTGYWKLFQSINHHRYSTDDLVTSWVSVQMVHLIHGQTFINPYLDQQSFVTDTSTTNTIVNTLTESNFITNTSCHSIESNKTYISNHSNKNLHKSIIPLPSVNHIDIGCGIGSVLLCNAWLLPNSIHIGIEIQKNRFNLAERSIFYNLGHFNIHQNRVTVINEDLRNYESIIKKCSKIRMSSTSINNATSTSTSTSKILKNNSMNINIITNSLTTANNTCANICNTIDSYSTNTSTNDTNNTNTNTNTIMIEPEEKVTYFDLVTGTPPYFDPNHIQSHNTSVESMGCLFEMKGNIFDYCKTASYLLRPPPLLPSSLSSASSIDHICTTTTATTTTTSKTTITANNNISNSNNSHINKFDQENNDCKKVTVTGNDTDDHIIATTINSTNPLSVHHTTNTNTNTNNNINNISYIPSIFVVCHSSLHSKSVYLACAQNKLIVIKRLDCFPKQGKPSLFSVFTIISQTWLLFLKDIFINNCSILNYINSNDNNYNNNDSSNNGNIKNDNNGIINNDSSNNGNINNDSSNNGNINNDTKSIQTNEEITLKKLIQNINLIDALKMQSELTIHLDNLQNKYYNKNNNNNSTSTTTKSVNIHANSTNHNYNNNDINELSNGEKNFHINYKGTGRVQDTVYGEYIESLYIRKSNNDHTVEYANILKCMGKPSSYDKEKFSIF